MPVGLESGQADSRGTVCFPHTSQRSRRLGEEYVKLPLPPAPANCHQASTLHTQTVPLPDPRQLGASVRGSGRSSWPSPIWLPIAQEVADFFCKGPDSKYFSLCGPYCLYCNYSSLMLWSDSGHK